MRPRRRRLGPLAGLISLVLGAGCGAISAPSELSTGSSPDTAAPRTTSADGARMGLPLENVPDVATLLTLLGQGHARMRAQGPHLLEYDADFALGPAGEGDLPRPAVGHGIQQRQAVRDSLSLTWASEAGSPPHFRLLQENDKGAGREIVVAGGRIFTRMADRGWFEREEERNIHDLWLDDASHAVLDMLALAAPQLALDEHEAVSVEGRPALRIGLRLAPNRDTDLLAVTEPVDPASDLAGAATSGWRARIQLRSVVGSITLDQETGLWLDADVALEYTTQDRERRPLRGRTRLRAKLRLVDGAPEVLLPTDASPLPERLRPEIEARSLLRDLAGQ